MQSLDCVLIREKLGQTKPYVVIFYAVLVFVDTYSKGGSKTIGIINLRLLKKTFLYMLHLWNDLL